MVHHGLVKVNSKKSKEKKQKRKIILNFKLHKKKEIDPFLKSINKMFKR